MKVFTVDGSVTVTMTDEEARWLRHLRQVIARAWIDEDGRPGYDVLSEMVLMMPDDDDADAAGRARRTS